MKREINPRMELDPDYIEELAGTDNLPPVTVTRDMVLVDGFHRLEASRRRGDRKIQVVVQDVDEDEALALAAKLNIAHGKRLTVLELAQRLKPLIKKRGWSQGKAARYFQKNRSWVTHYMNIANKLDTTLVTRVTTLDYGSARELAKLPPNRQGEAYRMARKMAAHDRRPSPSPSGCQGSEEYKGLRAFQECYKSMKTGGHVALLIQNTTELGEEMEKAGRHYADHVFDCYRFFVEAGFTPVQRINVPLSWEQFAGFDINKAKEERWLLGVVRDLLVMRKEREVLG